jgi:hypothetical protein
LIVTVVTQPILAVVVIAARDTRARAPCGG